MVTEQYPRIGGCQRDKTLFYIGTSEGLCPFCARPPDFVANLPIATEPFKPVEWNGAPETSAPPQESDAGGGMASDPISEVSPASDLPLELPGACPSCGAQVRVRMSESALEILPVSPAPSEETPAEEDAPLPSGDVAPSEEVAADDNAAGSVGDPSEAVEPAAPSTAGEESADVG